MSLAIRQLEPLPVWGYFCDLNQHYRATFHEETVIAWLLEFAKQRHLTARCDRAGNVAIEKPGSPGMEHLPAILCQGHTDMVTMPNDPSLFKNGVAMQIENGWVKSQNSTTLGADNGMAVAMMLALLDATDLAHPPLVALFTVSEEVGLAGARSLDPAIVKKGSYLLNLDSENDQEITISGAGGCDTTVKAKYRPQVPSSGSLAFRVAISGGKGGHSGADIHLQHGNAIKMLARLLFPLQADCKMQVAQMHGGEKRNAIPDSCEAVITVSGAGANNLLTVLNQRAKDLKVEWEMCLPDLRISIEPLNNLPAEVMSNVKSERLLRALFSAPNGVFRMSPEVTGLVQTSSNLAVVRVAGGRITVESLQRSSRGAEKLEIAGMVAASFESNGFRAKHSEEYAGWPPNPQSILLEKARAIYKATYGAEARIIHIHAGLECGVIMDKLKHLELDAVSIGPNVTGAHTVLEKIEIASVQRTWEYLKALLAGL